jgi:lysophospholipase L1-like esterase
MNKLKNSLFIFYFYHIFFSVSSRLRTSRGGRGAHVDTTKIWAEYDGVTGQQINITISNNISNSDELVANDNLISVPPKVDVTKIWSEYDGWSGVKQNISAPTESVSDENSYILSNNLTNTDMWQNDHHPRSKKSKGEFGEIGIVFLGDSTIAHINQNQSYWQYLVSRYHALNLAIPGEHTENLLYRLQNTDLSDIKNTRLVAILIGTLNIGARDSADTVKNGISAIVDQSKRIFSLNTTIVVFGILPRFSSRLNIVINATNTLLTNLYAHHPTSTHLNSNVKFIDLSSKFYDSSNPSGLREEFYMPDLLHPNTKGYYQMIESLSEELDS